MTRAEAWLACRSQLRAAPFSIVVFQTSVGEGRVVIGCREQGYLEVAIPAGYDEFELVGRISARLDGSEWDRAAYLASVELNKRARERAKGKTNE